jgi:transcriptional regulator with XRE-family HTH domain
VRKLKKHKPHKLICPRTGVGALITTLRQSNNITQDELARILKCSEARVSGLELGYADLNEMDIARLRKRLGWVVKIA